MSILPADGTATGPSATGPSGIGPSGTGPSDETAPRPNPAPANSRPLVCVLDRDKAAEIIELEQSCYPNPWSPPLIRAEFEKDISYRLGVLIDGRVAAYSFNYLLDEDLHLLNLAVAPSLQGRGLGKYLLCTLIARAIVRGVKLVSLEVRPSNAAALRLYHSLGFERVGLRKQYYRNNNEDAYLLERRCRRRDLKSLERLARTSARLFEA